MMVLSNMGLLLGLIISASLSAPSEGYWISLGATRLDSKMRSAACIAQGDRNVCYPLNSPTRYLKCGTTVPKVMQCRGGYIFDYVSRSCMPATTAQACPWWPVPRAMWFGLPSANDTNGPALSVPLGTFGVPGNIMYTLPPDSAANLLLYCPLIGHGPLGQNVKIDVSCPAPRGYVVQTRRIDLEPILSNNDTFPQRVGGETGIQAYCGDTLNIVWTGPFHLAQFLNMSEPNKLWRNQKVMTRPPQPVYKCPVWNYVPDARGFLTLVPNPGDEVLIYPNVGTPSNYTFMPNATGTYFLADPAAAHCRLGMVFKVTVTNAPANYPPKTITVLWEVSMDNYPDQDIYLGDSIYVYWPYPVQEAGLMLVPHMEQIA